MNKTIDEMVRDFTQVQPRTKSEVRRRINELLKKENEEKQAIINLMIAWDGEIPIGFWEAMEKILEEEVYPQINNKQIKEKTKE